MQKNPNYSGPKIDVEPEELSKYDQNWIIEPKIDGMWAALTVKDGRLSFLSRQNMEVLDTYTHAFKDVRLPFDGVFCGELEAATDRASRVYKDTGMHAFHMFDCLQIGKLNLRQNSLYQRKEWLSKMFDEISFLTYSRPIFRLVPYATNHFRQRYDYIVGNGGEGVILKNVNSSFIHGKNDQIIRCKEHLTDDFVLMGIGKTASGDKTGEWGKYKDGKLVQMMRCQPSDMSILNEKNIGIVAEFRGCGKQSSGTLRSAQFVKVREDKSADECIA